MNIFSIYALNEDGLIYGTKVNREFDLTPNVGDKVMSFYDEECEFYNIEMAYDDAGNKLYLLDAEIVKTADVRAKILDENSKIFMNTLYNFKNEYIMESFRDDPSFFKAMEYNLKKICSLYNKELKITYTDSNLSKNENIELIKKAFNNLYSVMNDVDKPYGLGIEKRMLSSAMTYLMCEILDVKMKDISKSFLHSNYEENDEGEFTYIPDLSSAHSNVQNMLLTQDYDLYKKLLNDKVLLSSNLNNNFKCNLR